MHSKISDYFASWCTDLISFLLLALHNLWVTPGTPDLAITVPFDLKDLSCFNLLKSRVLRRTGLRWCWFDKAGKDDREANTRLGTLRFLPYEIRQQIFKHVLEDYFDEYNQQKWQDGNKDVQFLQPGTWNLTKWQLNYEGMYCCCRRGEEHKAWDVVTWASYSHMPQYMKRAPLNLRFASESLKQEFVRIFLTSNIFEFTCPASLERFMDVLSPLQRRKLKCIKLRLFGYWMCIRRDEVQLFRHWMAVCQRLPPGIISVHFILSYVWRSRWTGNWPGPGPRDEHAINLAADLIGILSKKVSRACPRAKISLTGGRYVRKEHCDVLDSVLQELEPWSREWHEWHERKDGD